MDTPRMAPSVLAWGAWAVVAGELAAVMWLDRLTGRGDVGIDAVPFIVGVATAATVGALVAARTGHRVAWLLLGLAVSVGTAGFASMYAVYGGVARPGSLPAVPWVARASEAAFWPALAFLAAILVLTPTGRLPSPRWRWFIPIVSAGAALWSVATMVAGGPLDPPLDGLPPPVSLDALAFPLEVAAWIGAALCIGGVLLSAFALIVRFRHARGVERQQLRWVAFGAMVAAVAVVVALVAVSARDAPILNGAAGILVAVLPLSIAVSISRYRLYDLDRLVSRSLLYTLLTALVGVVYLALVVTLGQVAGTGPVTSGVAAVVAALLVGPLRAGAQRTVDRLIFGRRAEPFAVVSGLSRRLAESTSPQTALEALVVTVATDLRLPFVGVESHDGWMLAAHGELPGTGAARIALSHQGEDVGSLVLGLRRGEDSFDDRELALLEDLARHAGATARAAALLGDLQRARQRLVAAREEERRRLRRDLHDGLGPQLTAVTLKADAARNLLPRDPKHADRLLVELGADVRAAIADIRRLVYGLRPPGLDDLGLVASVRQHATACAINGTTIHVRADDDYGALPAPVEVAAYRIAIEAMTNVVRHARATRCEVELVLDGDLMVRISDDGSGLPPAWRAGVGIASMRERAMELGGTCTVEPADPVGTTVTARLPVVEAGP